MSPFSKYYSDTLIYNLGLSVVIGLYVGFIWGMIIFGTIGTVIGFVGHAYFKKNEYYFYYNYGYSKKALFLKVWTLNGMLMLVGIGLYVITISLF